MSEKVGSSHGFHQRPLGSGLLTHQGRDSGQDKIEKKMGQYLKIPSALSTDSCLFYPGNTFQKSLVLAVEGEVTSAQPSLI